jgi:predicted lipoprotein with Yx(FWY)xxD motif
MRKSLMLGTAAATLALLAGCGSSSKTTTSSAGATSSAATGAAPSPYGASTTAPSSSAAGSSGAVVVATKPGKLGTILAVGPKKMTVYLFEADTGPASACAGPCAGVWPPVTTTGTAKAGGSALAADLGTISRADGTKQVTYKGHPLYLFAKDKDQGDSYGQGIKSFGAGWYVLAPNGKKVDKS